MSEQSVTIPNGATAALSMFTEDEGERLMLMLGYGHGKDGFRQSDWEALSEWASMARMNEGLLQNVLAGDLAVCVQDGEVAFKPTPKGEAAVQALVASSLMEKVRP